MDRYDEFKELNITIRILNSFDPLYTWTIKDKVISKWCSADIVRYKMIQKDKITDFIKEDTFKSFEYVHGFLKSRIECLREMPLEKEKEKEKEKENSILDVEKDFCFDLDEVANITYDEKELFDNVREVYDYLSDKLNLPARNRSVEFLDFTIKQITIMYFSKYIIELDGILLGKIACHISDNIEYVIENEYPEQIKYFLYAVRYILEYKKREEEEEGKNIKNKWTKYYNPMSADLTVGDYILATKWHDGDPRDEWAIGYISNIQGDRYFVVDEQGELFRGNGFRRAKKITRTSAKVFLENKKDFENGSIFGLWVWLNWLDTVQSKLNEVV